MTSGTTGNTYTLTITGGAAVVGGLDVSVDNGALGLAPNSVETYTRLASAAEITHTGPKPFSGSTVTFTFTWTAPTVAAPTTVNMYAAGLSANGDGWETFDQGATANLQITVSPQATNAPPSISSVTVDPNPALVGQITTFACNATDTDPLAYSWTFGDGSTGSGSTITHAYTLAGNYTVTVSVSDGVNSAVTQNTTASVYTAPTPAVTAFSAPRRVVIKSGVNVTSTISVSADVAGPAAGTSESVTVFLKKDGVAYQSQPLTLLVGTGATAQFSYTFQATDAPSVTWTAYVMLGTTKSGEATKRTRVAVR